MTENTQKFKSLVEPVRLNNVRKPNFNLIFFIHNYCYTSGHKKNRTVHCPGNNLSQRIKNLCGKGYSRFLMSVLPNIYFGVINAFSMPLLHCVIHML